MATSQELKIPIGGAAIALTAVVSTPARGSTPEEGVQEAPEGVQEAPEGEHQHPNENH